MKGIKYKIRKRWYLRWILIPSNWLFQGIINSDKTEKIYKILFTLFLWILSLAFLRQLFLSFTNSLIVSFILAHTLNWFVNGNIVSIIIHRLLIGSISQEKAFQYLYGLQYRIQKIDAFDVVAVFGSLSRGEFNSSSDIDIAFVRKSGLRNAVKALWFLIKERALSITLKVPLEPLLADSIIYMKGRYQNSEAPVVLKSNLDILHSYYKKTLTLKEIERRNHPE